MGTVRARMVMEYDGTDFHGWQAQRDLRTVQGEMEARLRQLCGRRIAVTGSGRTDRGVHALGQVAHADLEAEEVERVFRGLPSILPDDVAVISISKTDRAFHSRFDAVSRLYRYRVNRRSHPLRNRYCHVLPPGLVLDTGAMREAAELSRGCNGWKAMAKEGSSVRNWQVDVMSTDVREDDSGWTFDIRANRFVRGMVRLWTGTLLAIGSRSASPELITYLLESGDRSRAGTCLPGKGLVLMEVEYG